MAESSENKSYCCVCGRELTEMNGWRLPERLGGGYVPYCQECQQRFYAYLTPTLGYKFSFYVASIMFNTPYIPDLFAEGKEMGKNVGHWRGYVRCLKAHGYDKQADGSCAGFTDGAVTDIKKAFGGDYATLEVDDEMLSDEEYQAGQRQSAEFWGYGTALSPYTENDYKELNKFYSAYTVDRADVSPQTDIAIQQVCKWTLEEQKLIEKGEYADAEKLDKIIRSKAEAEQLRKKDTMISDVARLDDIVLAINRAGLNIPDYEELCAILANHLFEPKTQYDFSWDTADQMLKLIINTSNWNEGRSEIDVLPPELSFRDNGFGELQDKPTEKERQIYQDLGLYNSLDTKEDGK